MNNKETSPGLNNAESPEPNIFRKTYDAYNRLPPEIEYIYGLVIIIAASVALSEPEFNTSIIMFDNFQHFMQNLNPPAETIRDGYLIGGVAFGITRSVRGAIRTSQRRAPQIREHFNF